MSFRRALFVALLLAGCTPTVVLGTLSLDAGGGFDIAGSCPVCDFGPPQSDILLFDLGDGGDGGSFGGDLGDGGAIDLAQ